MGTNLNYKYHFKGFCGSLREQTVDKLFIAPSPRELISILGKQVAEGISADKFSVVTNMAKSINTDIGPGCLVFDSVKADNVYFLKGKSDLPFSADTYPKGIASDVRVIENYTNFSIADLITNTQHISRKIGNRKNISLKKAIKERRHPYRFFIDGNTIQVHRVLLGGLSEDKRDIKKAVSGFIYVERTGRGVFKIKTKYANKATRIYENVSDDMFYDMEVFNSYFFLFVLRKTSKQNDLIVLLRMRTSK